MATQEKSIVFIPVAPELKQFPQVELYHKTPADPLPFGSAKLPLRFFTEKSVTQSTFFRIRKHVLRPLSLPECQLLGLENWL